MFMYIQFLDQKTLVGKGEAHPMNLLDQTLLINEHLLTSFTLTPNMEVACTSKTLATLPTATQSKDLRVKLASTEYQESGKSAMT
jgi:hypothetical protein